MTEGYVAATYSNLVDQMLDRGAEPGQGGHLEATAEEVGLAISRLDGSCFSFLASEMSRALGMDRAEPLMRRIVQRLGRYRGNEMRREVERRGLPLDAVHLLDYWDYSTDEAVSMGYQDRDPHYVAFEVPDCSFYDQMGTLCPQPLAMAMCEEVHKAIASEFNPAIAVWYPALLTRGESKCVFRFSMSREAAEMAAHQAERVSELAREAGKPLVGERGPKKADAAASYRELSRGHVIFYHYVVDGLLRAQGQERTREIVRRAMHDWGSWRGKEMREDHQSRGWPLNLDTFVTYFDDPSARDAWVAENVTLDPQRHTMDVTSSAYFTMFESLGTGEYAAVMYDEALPAQAEAYEPSIRLAIPLLLERGDPRSRFAYTMGS